MTGVDLQVLLQLCKPTERTNHSSRLTAGEIRPTAATGKEGISGEQVLSNPMKAETKQFLEFYGV